MARIRADTKLYGSTFFESAQVDSWADWSTTELELPVNSWLFPVLGFMPPNPKAVSKAKNDIKELLTVLNNHLQTRTFLVGNNVTLADIIVVSTLVYPAKFLMDAAFRKPFPNVFRWFRTCVNQAAFRAVLGEVPLAEKELELPKKEKAPKKKEAKKKEEKPAKKEEKPQEQPKKKAKHPLEELPRSPMVLDEWKRTFSNAENFYDAMPKFWDMLDREGWSIWFADYNYNSDNTVAFMTSNLVGGFMQRSDALRKYAFGTMAVLNNQAPFEIKGCWLMRGQEIKHMLEANPDAEYYTWTKMENLDDPELRKKVADLWCAEESIDGKAVYDSKTFK